MIHFWSPVIIRFKNGLISFRFSSDSQMETRSIKFFTVNSSGTQVSSFFWYPVLCKWFKIVLWSMFSSVAMSRNGKMSVYLDFFKGEHQCKFFRKSIFFGLKFSLNLLKYEAKGFIHENFFFCLISRFSWGVSGVSHTATCYFKRVFLKTRFFKTARTITRTIFNIFFSNFNHIFQKTFWRETRTDFSISQFKQFL